MTAIWPIAVIRPVDSNDSNAAKAAGDLRAVSERRERQKPGAGQRPFVCAGTRPTAVLQALRFGSAKPSFNGRTTSAEWTHGVDGKPARFARTSARSARH